MVDICRPCGEIVNARRAIGLAAAKMPLGIPFIELSIFIFVYPANRGVTVDENDGGRSRKKSGTGVCAGWD